MKIAIIGYGKMGKAVEEIALERGHSVAVKVDQNNSEEITADDLANCDVGIEFSRPENVVANIEKGIQARLPMVVGTTGWYDEYERICGEVKTNNSALLAATNFSVGVNLFFELNKKLSSLMAPHSDYQAEIEEIHHTQKLDSPSGTAITLAEGLIDQHPSYSKWKNEMEVEEGTLPIISKRIEKVPGTHTVKYSSSIDDIEITHTANNRKGFALGAVIAAEFLKDKSGVYTMKDVLKI